VPSNGSVLVITQPQINLLPGEVDKLLRYVDGGGNLLWLLDAEPLHAWNGWHPSSAYCSRRESLPTLTRKK